MAEARLVDLSVPLDDGTQVFPGDPLPALTPATTIAHEGYNVLRLHLGSQTGTHVDAPYHVLERGLRVDELPLSRFLAPLVVADVRGLAPRTPITWDHLRGVPGLGPGVALVLRTGWSAHRGGSAYFAHPYLEPAAAQRLLDLGVLTVGLDAPSIDETVLGRGRPELPTHQLLAAAGGVVVENLTALESVELARPWLSVLPLRLTGADGAPCRAVALELPASV